MSGIIGKKRTAAQVPLPPPGYIALFTDGDGRPKYKDDQDRVFDYTGARGPAGTVEVGTVATVASDQAAEVTNIGTPSAAILNFKIPRGRSIVSITRTAGNGAPGTTDTYTIAYDAGAPSTFQVKNGADGVSVAVRDEGTSLTSAATSMNFVGGGVMASASGSEVTVVIPGYTDEQAQDAAAALLAGTQDGLSFTYDDAGNRLSGTNTDKGSSARTAHEAAADPHTQYLTQARGDARYVQPSQLPAPVPSKLAAKISNLFTSAANSAAVQTVLTLTVPANYLTAGKTFNIRLDGTQSQSAAATNVVCAIFVNGTQVVSAAVAGGTAAQTNRSICAEGSILYNGSVFYGNITTGISGVLPVGNANVAGVAANAENPVTIEIRVQTSTANAANIIRLASAFISEI